MAGGYAGGWRGKAVSGGGEEARAGLLAAASGAFYALAADFAHRAVPRDPRTPGRRRYASVPQHRTVRRAT